MSWLTLARLIRAIAHRLRRSAQNSPSRQSLGSGRRSGPPVIAFARAHCSERRDIEIDALETEFHVRASGIAIRAWLIVGRDDMPADLLSTAMRAAQKLDMLPPPARQIFYLTASYGLTVAEVARLLGMSRRKTRRYLLQAIACLDSRSL
ncbi:hypothetical protein Sj15T_10290 [Sphingobium sp. TA15]|uniref:ECF-type sigma factor n=1 Tax=Sphingobium indicum (strain DSM 16413 / CCM 7287 / MTCC 6362 / UT26 / NBRC 101211 / UT26S) TaxID=452662 RepID=D4Z8V0_SPHIU|nr:sigma factor-like helix-turn-helix DNA-binding protein [Sphingobium indicum]BAI99032.1 ECF-type sigma factor [Sphingobium indicum UT26S]BDD66008.1 hypothetical protein Sj15T_10290 [Sphingobium sp. TA15]